MKLSYCYHFYFLIQKFVFNKEKEVAISQCRFRFYYFIITFFKKNKHIRSLGRLQLICILHLLILIRNSVKLHFFLHKSTQNIKLTLQLAYDQMEDASEKGF